MENVRKFRNDTTVVTVYKVNLPAFIWPGKVTLKICYTEFAAQQFITDYPNRFLIPFMTVEKEEIICYETD